MLFKTVVILTTHEGSVKFQMLKSSSSLRLVLWYMESVRIQIGLDRSTETVAFYSGLWRG